MPKLIDLTGQRFGRLIVIKDSGKRDCNGGVIWTCICDCGNECNIKGKLLRSGETKSCGCYNIERIAERGRSRKIDLTGEIFGKWTVLQDSGEREENGNILWKCICECGTIKNVDGQSLKKRVSQSCGCLKTSYGELKILKILEENHIKFETEKMFDDCIFEDTNRKARFDFYINNTYIIEYDGQQHFKPTGGWHTEESFLNIQKHDKIKNQYCFEHNLPIIRIPYTHYNELCLEDLKLETSKFLINKESVLK